MRFDEWLDAERGRTKLVADTLKNGSISAVSQWRTNGVPKEYMLAIRDLTEGEVTLEEMLTFDVERKGSIAQQHPEERAV